jgi:PhzF family phenazine biosynthesis protein
VAGIARRFKQVDAFTDTPLRGNPVAVVLDGDGLSDNEMQRLAAWTNLSETTFVLKPTSPGADYWLRIFHPTGELPFAGHPTIGSAHAILEAGVIAPRDGRMVMQCGAGDLPIRIYGSGATRRIYVEAPVATMIHDYAESAEAIGRALGVPIGEEPPPAAFANGPVWLFVPLETAAAVSALQPDMSDLVRLSKNFNITGFAPFAITEGDTRIHIRAFAPAVGVTEDPVTGSANAALPAYLAEFGLLGRAGREYVSSQGTELGRDGRVFVRVLDDAGRAEIGGHAVTVIGGEIAL